MYLVRSLELHQLDADQFTRLALVRMKTGRLDDAAGLLRHAIEMRPKAAGYHYALGIVLKQKGDAQGAINEFEAELVNNPDQTAAREQIAELKSKIDITGQKR
jgi:tetratricopeptide (TPR) repeat protein